MDTTTVTTWTAYAAALGCENIRDERDAAARVNSCLAALGYVRSCPRCGGTGHHSRNSFGSTTCYTCDGRCKVVVKITAAVIEAAAKRVAAGELDAWRAANRARAAAKRAIAPVMAAVNHEWKTGAVHEAYRAFSNAWRAGSGADLYTAPEFIAAGLINDVQEHARAMASDHPPKGTTPEYRLAEVEWCLATVRAINATFAEYMAGRPA